MPVSGSMISSLRYRARPSFSLKRSCHGSAAVSTAMSPGASTVVLSFGVRRGSPLWHSLFSPDAELASEENNMGKRRSSPHSKPARPTSWPEVFRRDHADVGETGLSAGVHDAHDALHLQLAVALHLDVRLLLQLAALLGELLLQRLQQGV